jgi:hypothetical protein
MSEDVIDSTKAMPEPAAKPKRKAWQEGQAREERGTDQEGHPHAEDGSRQQEGRGHRDDEARQGRHARGDHEGYWLAAAHRTWLREHPGQQGRGEDRVVQERCWRTDVQDREITSGNSSSKRRLGHAPGRRSCFQR